MEHIEDMENTEDMEHTEDMKYMKPPKESYVDKLHRPKR